MFQLSEAFVGAMAPVLNASSIPIEEFTSGIEALDLALVQLSIEAAQAEKQGIPLPDAVREAERFPNLRRVHLGVRDLLEMDLPPEVLPFVEMILDMPELPGAAEFRLQIARSACDTDIHPARRALARFILLQAVRLNAIARLWKDEDQMIRIGLDDRQVDEIAMQEVDELVKRASVLEGTNPIRPLEYLVSTTISRIDARFDILKSVVPQVVAEVYRIERRRADLEAELKSVPADIAVLIRNYIAPAFEEQRLTVERLTLHHPLLLDGVSRDVVYQRQRRAIATLEEKGSLPQVRNTRLIDLLIKRM